MRGTLAKAYLLLLQMGGFYGAVAALTSFVLLPAELARGSQVAMPAMTGTLAMLIGVTLLRPHLMPDWFARPQRVVHALPVLAGNVLLPLLFFGPVLFVTAALGFEEHVARNLALIAASPIFVLLGLALCTGIPLCLLPEDGEQRHEAPLQAPIRPRRPKMPKLRPEELADLRRQRSA